MKKPDPILPDDFDDNPEWTAEDFARARPAAEVMGPEFMAKMAKGGRPRSANPRPAVTLRLDAETARHLRATGKGWQTRTANALADLVAQGKL